MQGAKASRATILFNLCGHGHFDMQAYIDYFGGKLEDLDYDEAELAMALAGLPSVKQPPEQKLPAAAGKKRGCTWSSRHSRSRSTAKSRA